MVLNIYHSFIRSLLILPVLICYLGTRNCLVTGMFLWDSPLITSPYISLFYSSVSCTPTSDAWFAFISSNFSCIFAAVALAKSVRSVSLAGRFSSVCCLSLLADGGTVDTLLTLLGGERPCARVLICCLLARLISMTCRFSTGELDSFIRLA